MVEIPTTYLRVGDFTDQGPGGDFQEPVMNDNVLYHSQGQLAGRWAGNEFFASSTSFGGTSQDPTYG